MTTETKFTPGPWEAYENAEDKCFYVAQQDGAPYTPDYSDVCGLECRTWSGERPIVQRSNAHLIAAAPDLYDALQNLLSRLANDADGHAWFMDEQEASIAALAKARGECGAQDDAPVPDYNAEQKANAHLIAAAPAVQGELVGWRNIEEEKPEDGQDCITKMKHGIIQGTYSSEDDTFSGYYWREMGWYATHWAPAEEAIYTAPQPAEQQPAPDVTVTYDLSPASVEGAIRDRLIAMGWTPPSQHTPP